MGVTSIAFPRGVEEPAEAGLSLADSERVLVPRIAQAPVSMECTFMQEIALGSFSLVLGRILMVHVRDEAVIDAGRQYVDASKLDLIGRMEGGWYTTTRDRFEMPSISLSEWQEARSERSLASGSE
jgi:flavin reductase (DIM6/NTAB) family NADH-FMN oxidoreductase RutF